MGWVEIPCQLCGVSFNISRLRTKEEPRSASWEYGRLDKRWPRAKRYEPCEGDNAQYANDPCREAGCALVYRGDRFENGPLWPEDPEDREDPEDPNFEYRSESDNEALEYDSDEDMQDAGTEESYGEGSKERDEPSETWVFRADSSTESLSENRVDSEFLPLDTISKLPPSLAGPGRIDDRWQHYEHVAGERCALKQDGYNGHNISVQEMEDCQTVQFLIRKAADWRRQSDDMDFEIDSAYHLTGLAPWLDPNFWESKLSPIRHGVRYAEAQDDWGQSFNEDELQKAIPMHPACFQIFIVLSNAILGKVDIDGIANLRNRLYDACIEGPRFGERNYDVKECAEQVWQCRPGSEYLVTNPIFVPGYREICEAAVSDDESFDVHQSPFPGREGTLPDSASAEADVFLGLPMDLKLQIIETLDSQDIASLRLSSRAFTHLPMTVWHKLLCREMAFLYEAWSDHAAPYHWACLDVHALIKDADDIEKAMLDRFNRLNVLRDAHDELYEVYKESDAKIPQELLDKFREDLQGPSKTKAPMLPIGKLPFHKTNWYKFYTEVKANWTNLRGLENRRRIFIQVYSAVENIKKGRAAKPDVNSDHFTMEGAEWTRERFSRLSPDDLAHFNGVIGEPVPGVGHGAEGSGR